MPAHARFRSLFAFGTALAASAALLAPADGVSPLEITAHSIDGGGGTSTGGTFVLIGTIGQHDASVVEATNGPFVVLGGFQVGGGSGAPPCPADISGDGEIGFTDLLAVLSAWGPCAGPCPQDLDNSGGVGFNDLLTVLSAWGPC